MCPRLLIFPRLHERRVLILAVAHQRHEGLDDMVEHPQRATAGGEPLELAAHEVPLRLQGAALVPGGFHQELALREFLLQLELHEWFRQRGAVKLAIVEIKRHGVPRV